MLFANKKEEVLDIQLTPHGKYLLSIGKLKPVYYSFHDSNILYDGRYALSGSGLRADGTPISENPKDIEDRIQHKTPQPKTVTSRVTRADNLKRIFEPSINLSSDINRATALATVSQMNEQKVFLSTHPIGSCSPTTDLAPKWSIKVLNGEISGSVPHLTSSYQTLNIPQIDINVVYKTAVLSTDTSPALPMKPDPALSSKVYDDGTYIAIDPDHLLLEVIEDNTEYNKTNFEVEVFEIVDEIRIGAKSGPTGARTDLEVMKPLLFREKVNLIQNNILLDPSEIPKQESIGENAAMVDYYFNLFVDKEIDPADLCAAKEAFETKNLFVDLDVECSPSGLTSTRYDVYTGPEPVEPCPIPEEGVGGVGCDD